MNQNQGTLKQVNVYIPFLEIYLQLEIDITNHLNQLAKIIHQVTNNDNEITIFRFKYKGEILNMQTSLDKIKNFDCKDPNNYLTALAQVSGA